MFNKLSFIRPDHAMIMALKDHKIVEFTGSLADPVLATALPSDWPRGLVVNGHRYVIYVSCEKVAVRPDLALFVLRNLDLVVKLLDGFLIGISLSQLASDPATQRWMKQAGWPIRFNGEFSVKGTLVPPRADNLRKGYGLDLYPVKTEVASDLAAWLELWNGFDWYYQFSDSATVWKNGEGKYNKLMDMIPPGKLAEWTVAMDALRPSEIRNGA